ncbi:hypothetical protein [Haloarcula sp. JP-L23]|nr:hypothetical protein G9465_17285 [Haloarcula sp. JP-L23]
MHAVQYTDRGGRAVRTDGSGRGLELSDASERGDWLSGDVGLGGEDGA